MKKIKLIEKLSKLGPEPIKKVITLTQSVPMVTVHHYEYCVVLLS